MRRSLILIITLLLSFQNINAQSVGVSAEELAEMSSVAFTIGAGTYNPHFENGYLEPLGGVRLGFTYCTPCENFVFFKPSFNFSNYRFKTLYVKKIKSWNFEVCLPIAFGHKAFFSAFAGPYYRVGLNGKFGHDNIDIFASNDYIKLPRTDLGFRVGLSLLFLTVEYSIGSKQEYEIFSGLTRSSSPIKESKRVSEFRVKFAIPFAIWTPVNRY